MSNGESRTAFVTGGARGNFAHAGVEAAILSGEQAVGRLGEGAPVARPAVLEQAPEALERPTAAPTAEPAAVRRTGADGPASGLG